MNVLVACEESQAVCLAFRAKGHNAFSCDIKPCSGGAPQWHICGNVLPLLNGNCLFKTMDGQRHVVRVWDLIIAHPPCTYLSVAGNRAYSPRFNSPEQIAARVAEREKAADFFFAFVQATARHIAIENPTGYMNTHYRKPDQIIHLYYFADSIDSPDYHLKRTCLWLYNLPLLERTSDLPKPEPMYICQGKLSKGKRIGWCEGMRGASNREERAALRSKTAESIAMAMAEQWGDMV